MTSAAFFVRLFHIVNIMSNKFKIDESHGMIHSMKVLNYAHDIYETQKYKYPILQSQERVIYMASVLHDMCDKKYMNETEGIKEIHRLLDLDSVVDKTEEWKKNRAEENRISQRIMQTMSYSTVKKYGYPDLGEYQHAYHIVREADLLSAYDFDRSMMYHMRKHDCDIQEAYYNAHDIFCSRILKYNMDGLFVSDYAKHASIQLHNQAVRRMVTWKKILQV